MLFLYEPLESCDVWAKASCVTTSRRRGCRYRGGIHRYARIRGDVVRWAREDQNVDAFFTIMVDLYRLPTDFPGYASARAEGDAYRRVEMLERALSEDIGDRRFIPYLQLHEFEALLLVDPQKLALMYPKRDVEIRDLVRMASGFSSPELIDDGEHTAPSKRIISLIPQYDRMKVSAGPAVAEGIGLPTMRCKCPHFDGWLRKLEALG